jgi:hypothetical protein
MAGLIEVCARLHLLPGALCEQLQAVPEGHLRADQDRSGRIDNRTAGYRLCGEGTKGVRIECRIGGSDINPYLALRGTACCGPEGIEERVELDAADTGDVYGMEDVPPFRTRCARRPKPCATRNAAGSDGRLRSSITMSALRNGSRKSSTRRHRLGNRPRFRKVLRNMTRQSQMHLADRRFGLCRAPCLVARC